MIVRVVIVEGRDVFVEQNSECRYKKILFTTMKIGYIINLYTKE